MSRIEAVGAEALERVARAGPQHAQLQTRIAQLGDPVGALATLDDSVYTLRGKLAVQAQRLRALDAQAQASFALGKARRRPLQQLLVRVRRPLRVRLAAQEQAWRDARTAASDVRDEVARLFAEIEAAQTRKALLELQKPEQAELLGQLDGMYAALFAPAVGSITHPREQAALYQLDVLAALSKMLQTEAEREKQLRTAYLDKAQRLTKELLACVRSAIGHTTEARIGSHIPTAQEMALGHEYEVTRTITPTLQQAKILSGRMHTTIATARVFNVGVAPLPDMSIVDLHTLPTRRAAQHHMGSLHHSLEASFAQATWCINHCAREKDRSTMRHRRLTELARERRARAGTARTQLRALRARIVEHVHAHPLCPESGWTDATARACWAALDLPLARVMAQDEGAPPAFGGALPSAHTSAQGMVRSLLAGVRDGVDADLPPLQGVGVLAAHDDAPAADPEWYLDPSHAGYEYLPGADRVFGEKQTKPGRLLPQPLGSGARAPARSTPAPPAAPAAAGLAAPSPAAQLERAQTPPPPHPDHAHLALESC